MRTVHAEMSPDIVCVSQHRRVVFILLTMVVVSACLKIFFQTDQSERQTLPALLQYFHIYPFQFSSVTKWRFFWGHSWWSIETSDVWP